jgi:endonuclease/exonuclease/phosphatase family metal-dependent hydrolase
MRRGLCVLLLLLAACGDSDSGSGTKGDVTVAQLNILHGTSGMCNQQENCRLAERIDLLYQWIARAGCPDVVTLQEVWRGAVPLLQAGAGSACPFTYEVRVTNADRPGPDEAAILSRYPILSLEIQPLFPGFRRAVHAVIDHPLRPLDVYTTHLASGSDGATVPCNGPVPCPQVCLDAGAQNRRECQAEQMAEFIEATRDEHSPVIITGDFNEEPGSFVYRTFTARGWQDAYLAAGNPECQPATGVGCTSGRQDENLSELESPVSNEVERIDFIFFDRAHDGFRCSYRPDTPRDADGDGTGTRLFTDEPNPFAPSCGPAPLPICWPSDHEGVQLDLNCD